MTRDVTLSGGGNKALYTSLDRRYNYRFDLPGSDQKFNATIREQAKSVGCVMMDADLTQNPTTQKHSLHNPKTLRQSLQLNGADLGENEKFGDEYVVGRGTGFLVGKDLFVTAAHVVNKNDSSEVDQQVVKAARIVFGFEMTAPRVCKTTFDPDDVYKVKEVVAIKYERHPGWKDWALLRLDRDVVGRKPLQLDYLPVQKDDVFYMIGCPYGGPLKYTDVARNENNTNRNIFQVSLDAFAGNSGSPVFRVGERNGIAGILCEGNPDYEKVQNYNGSGVARFTTHVVTSKEKKERGYEKCQRLNHLDALRTHIINDWNQLIPGLNVEATCDYKGCAYKGKEKVWTHQGFGDFNMNKVLCTTACGYCKSPLKTTAKFAVKDCQYTYEYIQTDKLVKKANTTETGILTFDVNGWSYFSIQTSQTN